MKLESLTIAAFVIGSSLTAFAQSAESGIAGAWTSGSDVDACDTSPITHFMSDGVVAVFMKKDGDLHSLGSWSVADTELTMTHNDFPLSGDGKSNPAIKLDILSIDASRFVTRNSDGVERTRVRCQNIEISMGHDDHDH